MTNACGINCDLCPAAARCGKTCNFCVVAAHRLTGSGCGGCAYCGDSPLLNIEVRQRIMDNLGGLDLVWPRTLAHPTLPDLPLHLPVLVQAYADVVEMPWVAIHGGRLLGSTGHGLTPKHRGPLHEVYRLSPNTKIALEFYVEDRVLEGLWAARRTIISELASVNADLILAPNFSVWSSHPRFEHIVQIRRAYSMYMELAEAGLPVVPDIGFYLFEPDGRLWAEWVNSQPDLKAVSLFCGGKKVNANHTAHRETVEDIALFHQAVRAEVTFILGGVHSLDRLRDYGQAAPGRRLVICNGMAYSLAQRRRLLDDSRPLAGRSARECFLLNCAYNDSAYARLLTEEVSIAA